MAERLHVDLTAFDRARPYVSRVLAAVVGAGCRYAATKVGFVELTDPATVDALAFLAAMVVYGALHKALDARINQTDAARPTVAALTQADPVGSASGGLARRAPDLPVATRWSQAGALSTTDAGTHAEDGTPL